MKDVEATALTTGTVGGLLSGSGLAAHPNCFPLARAPLGLTSIAPGAVTGPRPCPCGCTGLGLAPRTELSPDKRLDRRGIKEGDDEEEEEEVVFPSLPFG